MRNKFEREMNELNEEILKMCVLTQETIDAACEVLKSRDKVAAEEIIQGDVKIDQLEHMIEAQCLRLLLHQQPVAKDLREVSAALKMVTDMERVGDQAADICEISTHMVGEYNAKSFDMVLKMGEISSAMVKGSVDSYLKKDIILAEKIINDDDKVDGLFEELKTSLMQLLGENNKAVDQVIDMLMIGKYFERIGDHATNIAEWTIFSVTGQHKTERII